MKSLDLTTRDWLYRQPSLLLVLTTAMWAGNGVAGKSAIGEIAPMTLVCWRWLIACFILTLIARDDFKRDWPTMRMHWPAIILMGALGFTAFNSLFYLSAHYASAVNMTISQGTIPVFVSVGALFAVIFLGEPFHLYHAAALILVVGGILIAETLGRRA